MTVSPNQYNNMHNTPYNKFLSLKKIDEALLEFWSSYIQKSLFFNIALNENLNFKIEPYYGVIFYENDIIGQPYFIDLDFGSSQPVVLSIPRSLLSLILGSYLDPLLPEHFDDNFVCDILTMICIDVITHIKEKTGITIKFQPFSGTKGQFQSQWRLYAEGNPIFYPILITGEQAIIDDLLKRLFVYAVDKPKINPYVELKIISMVRKISIARLRNLKLGEIIILMTKRHPINEPLVLIGNKIVLHTVLKDMALHLIRDPSIIYDVEELKMTINDDDIDALPEEHSEAYHNDAEMDSDNELDLALNDYKITVTFELNRLEMPAKIVSQFSQGSIINLQKQITEDIFITVSGRTIAIGEVVQVGRNFGILIKEVF